MKCVITGYIQDTCFKGRVPPFSAAKKKSEKIDVYLIKKIGSVKCPSEKTNKRKDKIFVKDICFLFRACHHGI